MTNPSRQSEMPKPEAQPVTFSVALCTYQGAAYIAEQLQSMLDQTVLPDEIVIRDDGSTDDTLAICRDIAQTSPVPITILPPGERLGVAGNFFACARACCMDWILFADQDDRWLPERVALFKNAIADHPDAPAIQSDGLIADAHLNPTGETLWRSYFFSPREQALVQAGRGEVVLARHVFVTGAALVVRRDWFLALPVPAAQFYHDEWIGWFAGPALRLLPAVTFLYRQHQSQQTGLQTTWHARWQHLLDSQLHARTLLERDLARFPRLATALSESGQPEPADLVAAKTRFVQRR
ncbi:MAG: glycosyltransferase, partial [Clostridia bacterium]|nr:glycosyltransferase [Clostridia bacterium]